MLLKIAFQNFVVLYLYKIIFSILINEIIRCILQNKIQCDIILQINAGLISSFSLF